MRRSKLRETLGAGLAEFAQKLAANGPVRVERAPDEHEPDLTRVEKIGHGNYLVKPNAHKLDPETVYCSCKKPTKSERKGGYCGTCDLKKVPYSPRLKVTIRGKKISCTCRRRKHDHATPCEHIALVLLYEGIDPEVPYAFVRRRKRTVWVFDIGTPSESTRRKHARKKRRTRLPILAAELCWLLFPDDKRQGPNGGAIGYEDRLIAYIALMKAFYGSFYEDIPDDLSGSVHAEILRSLDMKKTLPSTNALITRFDDPVIVEFLLRCIELTAELGRRIDTMLIGDAHDTAVRSGKKSRDVKTLKRDLSYRGKAPMRRGHFGVGDITNLAYSYGVTLNVGTGSNESAHLPWMVRHAKDINPGIIAAAFDPGYDSGANFKACEAAGIRLFCDPKRNENFHQNVDVFGEMGAEQGELFRLKDPRYRDGRRKRSKAEGTCSVLMLIANQGRFWLRKSKAKNKKYKDGPTPDQVILDYRIANGLPLPNPNDYERLSELPQGLLANVLRAAQEQVGWRPLVEALAAVVVNNLCQIITLEEFCEEQAEFGVGMAFRPVRTIKEEFLDEEIAVVNGDPNNQNPIDVDPNNQESDDDDPNNDGA